MWFKVRDLIADLGAQGINPNQELYALLIRACLKVDDLTRARQVLDIVEANEQEPKEVIIMNFWK
jgi:hypothetical protein